LRDTKGDNVCYRVRSRAFLMSLSFGIVISSVRDGQSGLLRLSRAKLSLLRAPSDLGASLGKHFRQVALASACAEWSFSMLWIQKFHHRDRESDVANIKSQAYTESPSSPCMRPVGLLSYGTHQDSYRRPAFGPICYRGAIAENQTFARRLKNTPSGSCCN
jgi:hypothetical protein